MSQFIISCKESRIETNRSFYGCFELGPFEPSQSLTIANTLRRTLLSEIYGLAIVSVEIEGASHEYSSLPGVHESVLDILLNLKEIVLKKAIKNFTPQIGYLRARGPGVVTASHLRLPPFIQCVDPDQYIATLSHNGFLNIKFVVQYGNKWLASGRMPDSLNNLPSEIKDKTVMRRTPTSTNSGKASSELLYNLHFKKRRLFLKKLKDFGFSGTNAYLKMFSKNLNSLVKYKKKRDFIFKGPYLLKDSLYLKSASTKNKEKLKLILKITNKYPGINLKKGTYYSPTSTSAVSRTWSGNIRDMGQGQATLQESGNKAELLKVKSSATINSMREKITNNRKKLSIKNQNYLKRLHNNQKKAFFNVNSLNIDAIFNPITKVNYIIEVNDFKIAQNKLQTSFKATELYETLAGIWPGPKNKHLIAGIGKTTDGPRPMGKTFSDLPVYIDNSSLKKTASTGSPELTTLLELNQELSALTKETIKHNIILEIWTNGSLHPRDALNQALKNLIKVFVQLKNVQPFGLNNLLFNSQSLSSNTLGVSLPFSNISQEPSNSLAFSPTNKKQLKRGKSDARFNTKASGSGDTPSGDALLKNNSSSLMQKTKLEQFLLKNIRMGEFKKEFLEKLSPLNETTFLTTYISPKIRNYYLNKTNLLNIIKISIENNKVSPIFIADQKLSETFTTFRPNV